MFKNIYVDNINKCINWSKLSADKIELYKRETSRYLNDITIPDGLKCLNPMCKNKMHTNDIHKFYTNLNSILISASNIPAVNTK